MESSYTLYLKSFSLMDINFSFTMFSFSFLLLFVVLCVLSCFSKHSHSLYLYSSDSSSLTISELKCIFLFILFLCFCSGSGHHLLLSLLSIFSWTLHLFLVLPTQSVVCPLCHGYVWKTFRLPISDLVWLKIFIFFSKSSRSIYFNSLLHNGLILLVLFLVLISFFLEYLSSFLASFQTFFPLTSESLMLRDQWRSKACQSFTVTIRSVLVKDILESLQHVQHRSH